MFYHRGFEQTSFASIAEVVQLSRGNFYHHFKAKDDLLDAVIATRLEETRTMLAQWESQTLDRPVVFASSSTSCWSTAPISRTTGARSAL
ncbi:TetR/AcrR family transcriptional regulator [Nocardia terrae]|uniref:TetR/AcrR family transcriptional regulator n=1 Tax=Nocardia terrae TaxID=2675851 RepID=UPI0018DFE28A|nr:TetR/AcrR family transcriptional regulator [Nocardia terrae]